MDAEHVAELSAELVKHFTSHYFLHKLDEAVSHEEYYPKTLRARCLRCRDDSEHRRRSYEDAALIEGITQLSIPKLALGAFLKLHPFAKVAAKAMDYIPVVAYVCDSCKQVSPVASKPGLILLIDLATGAIDHQTPFP